MKSTDNQVKVRPVNWTSDEVRAALAGRKTQIRVPIKLPSNGFELDFDLLESDLPAIGFMNNKFGLLTKREIHPNSNKFERGIIPCPLGKVGDHLWVRETWKIGAWHEDDGTFAIDYKASPELTKTPWIYIADEEEFKKYWVKVTDELNAIYYPTSENGRYYWEAGKSPLKWKSPVTMPRWASRLLLEIVDLRVERLHNITHNDAVSEACFISHPEVPLTAFIECWRARYGDKAWQNNPWVWVIDFKVLEGA
ncbi:MAG: hypothetical protein Q4P13_07335 [Psychrobacter sp.]|nr:hypothetical protein [Psychrobacter sp.]